MKKIVVVLCFAISFVLVIPIFTVYAASQTADFEGTGYSHLEAIDTAEGFAFETYEPDNTIKVSGALFYSQFGYNNSSCVSPYSFNDGRPTPYQFRIKRQDGSNFSLSSIFLFADGYGCQYSNMRGYRDGSMVYEQTNIDMDSGVAVSGLNWINIDEIRIFQVDDDPEGLAMAVDNIVFDLSMDTTAPTLDTNNSISLNEGASKTITNSNLSSSDNISTASEISYTITDLPDNGSVKNNGSTLGLNGTFTQADINNNLVTYVHNGSNTTSDSFVFKVSDSAGNSVTNKTFSISVTAVDDDSPTVVTNSSLNLNEGASAIIGLSKLKANDEDSNNASLVYTITALLYNGYLENIDNPGNPISVFTQQDLADNKIRYVHDDSNTTSDRFEFKVSDGANELSGQTFNIVVASIDDDAPTIVTNSGLNLDEGATAYIGTSKLEADDDDSNNSSLIYSVTSSPSNGRLENTDAPGSSIVSFTQQNLVDGKIRYVHDDSNTTLDSFYFKVSDGTNELANQMFSISINPVDDTAPIIEKNTGISVVEGENSGISYSELRATDADTNDTNLIFTVTTAPTRGQIEKTSAPGSAISSFTQQDINSGNIIYAHAGSNLLADSFEFKVSDGTREITDQTFNITVVSSDTTAPTVSTNSGLSITRGKSASLSSKLVASDAETTNGTIVYTVTNTPDNGNLSLTSFTQAQLDAGSVVYTHNGSSTSTDSFTFKIEDTNGNERSGLNFSIRILSPTPTPAPTPTPTKTHTSYATPTNTLTASATGAIATPSITMQPSETPTIVPTDTGGDFNASVQADVVNEDKNGNVTIEININDLPEGTKAVYTSNGEVVEFGDSETIKITVGKEEVSEDGSIELVVLDEDNIPLGSVTVEMNITEPSAQAVLNETESNGIGFTNIFFIVIGGVAFIGAALAVIYIVLARKRFG